MGVLMRLRERIEKSEVSREKHVKPERFAKLKRFGKKLAKYALIPAAALALSYGAVKSKPAMAQESPLIEDTVHVKEYENLERDSKIIFGGEVATNESGAATQGSINYKNMFGMGLGYISFFGGAQSPFATIRATPHVEVNGFKFYYNGSFMFAKINSWMYTYQGIGMGYTAELPKDFKLSMGVTAGGALSYPQFDNIHFKMTWGSSFGWKENVTVYGIVETYFAADTAIRSSNILDYKLKFQSVEAGAVGKYKKVFGVLFGKYDVIQSIYGAKIGATLEFTDEVVGHLWLGGGVSRYTNYMAGTMNFMLLAGMRISINSTIDSDWEMSHEQYGPGGTPMLPTIDTPPYYDPITPYDVQAESKVKSIDNFADFNSSYEGASEAEIIATARYLSRMIEQIGYDLKTMDELMTMNFFSPRVQWLASRDFQDIYHYAHAYLTLVDIYGSYHNIPENLKEQLGGGIAMCTGIHSMTAKFLNDNGIHALAASVNAKGGGHVITLGMTDEMTFIDDYGDWYETKPKSMAKILEAYARFNGVPTFYSQMFHPDKGYIGTYTTDSARILEKMNDGNQVDQMKSFILEVPAQ